MFFKLINYLHNIIIVYNFKYQFKNLIFKGLGDKFKKSEK